MNFKRHEGMILVAYHLIKPTKKQVLSMTVLLKM